MEIKIIPQHEEAEMLIKDKKAEFRMSFLKMKRTQPSLFKNINVTENPKPYFLIIDVVFSGFGDNPIVKSMMKKLALNNIYGELSKDGLKRKKDVLVEVKK